MNQPLPNAHTPMFRQYLRIKSQYPEAILFYRMGDFYEMFFDDARTASRVLNIALTTRDKDKSDPVPMCGVPFHAAEGYITRLVADGHTVAVCEQMEPPAKGTRLVRREVVRVITPGTILTEGYLADKRNNFLGAVCPGRDAVGLAFLDISTGDFVALEVPSGRIEDAAARLADFEPAELVAPEGARKAVPLLLEKAGGIRPAVRWTEPEAFDAGEARRRLLEQFGTMSLEPFGIPDGAPELCGAAGAVLGYARETQRTGLPHVRRLSVLPPGDGLVLDAATQRNLELVRSAATGTREGTLLAVLDETLTPMGGRLLRQWLLRPLTDVAAIGARLDALDALTDNPDLADGLRGALRGVLDLERLLSRLTLDMGGPRDLLGLRDSIAPLPALRRLLAGASPPLLSALREELDPLEDLHGLLERAIRDDAPVAARDGSFVKQAFDADLDRWLAVRSEGRSWVTSYEAKERERTGITTLRVRYNRVFGWYIEVTKANLGEVPPDYVRKQTLLGAERFTSPELTAWEARILEADERCLARELELLADVRSQVIRQGDRLRATCRVVAALDTLQSLAAAAVRRDWRRPLVDDSGDIDIIEGRHPVVEALCPDEPFIPNDCRLDSGERRILVITGPNMAGKSTFLRQTALIVLMAQMGSRVPAASARIGLADRIFTRVGASDFLVRGQSTFMVEMTETAVILNNATSRSLVILDEIGRGTGTFDGLAIAWAVAEHLHDDPVARPRTLFATHYHQLTELALTLSGVKNCSTAVREWGDRIVFLRKIVEGGTDKSYGIHVARLAGLPAPVVERAREIMANLEADELDSAGRPRLADHHGTSPGSSSGQLYLFGSPEREVLDELRRSEPDRLTPLDALTLLASLRSRLSREDRLDRGPKE